MRTTTTKEFQLPRNSSQSPPTLSIPVPPEPDWKRSSLRPSDLGPLHANSRRQIACGLNERLTILSARSCATSKLMCLVQSSAGNEICRGFGDREPTGAKYWFMRPRRWLVDCDWHALRSDNEVPSVTHRVILSNLGSAAWLGGNRPLTELWGPSSAGLESWRLTSRRNLA